MTTDMTADIVENSAFIPFPGIILKHAKPVSTINLIIPYEKRVTGCNKVKCPCRLWINCPYYQKMKWKKSRGNEDGHMKIIWEYYNNIFRLTYDMPIINMNG